MGIGDRIKKLREQIDISQSELADKINVSKQTLYKYENNIITNIPSDKIEAIAKVLKCSPAHLMGWDDVYSKESAIVDAGMINDIEFKELFLCWEQINEEGKKKLKEYAFDLSKIYKKK